MNRRQILAAFTAQAASLAFPAAWAEGPPQTRILVGYAAGGSADMVTRAYAESMRKTLGREVIVENRPGVGGTMVATIAKRGPADGSVLFFGNFLIGVLSPYTFRNPGFDPATDFVTIGQTARVDLALAVPASSPIHTLAEFVGAAKADPAKASYGTPAAGSMPHFFGVLLGEATGVKLQHIPYKGGPGMTADLIGGQLPSVITPVPDLVAFQRSGKVRILATSGDQRSAVTPEVPTFKELGYPSVRGTSWYCLFAPAATPPAELVRLEAALRSAQQDPAVRKALETMFIDPPNSDLAAFRRELVEERKVWGPLVKSSGFTAED